MKKIIDKVKAFFKKCVDFCKDTNGKINWKVVWDKTTTVLMVLVLSSPLFILAYIMGWFFTRQQF